MSFLSAPNFRDEAGAFAELEAIKRLTYRIHPASTALLA